MTPTQIQNLKAGDTVFAHYADEQIAGTIRCIENECLRVDFLVPHVDLGESDLFDPADVTLNLDGRDEPTPTRSDTWATFKDRAAIALKYGIPVTPLNGKIPLLPKWPETATLDPQQVAIWNNQYPDANCGMVAKLDLAGFWCLEVDSADLNERYKRDTGKNLPTNTLMVLSGGGADHGHRWFRHTPASIAMGNIKQEEAEGFSVRANNQQAVGPLSVHPDTCAVYTLLKDTEPTQAPDELVAWLIKQKILGTNSARSQSSAKDPSAIANAPIPSGARNSTLASLGGKWHHSGMDDDLVLESLLRANSNRCNPPLSDDEVKVIAKSVCRYDTTDDVAATVSFGDPKQNTKSVLTREMILRRGDQYDPSITPWLWPNRIVANNINVFSGEPDKGKSLCWADFVSRLTTNRDFPDSPNECGGPVDVIVMASEDDIDSTIIPRLIAAEANIRRIHFVEIQENESGTIVEGIAALDRDLPAIAKLIEDLRNNNVNVALIVVDPIIAFIGDADPNRDKEIRPIFSRMKTFSKKYGLAWLTVNHLNKNSSATSINRTSGAKSFVSAPRATWMFADDPDNPERRLMMKGKGNLVKQGIKSLAYRITETFIQYKGKEFVDQKLRPVGVPRIQWDGESEQLADDVLQAAADPASRRSIKAEELLKTLFDESPMGVVLASDAYQAGEAISPTIGEDKLKRAKAKLKVEVFRLNERWYWARGKEEMKAFRATVGLYIPKPEQPQTLYEKAS